MASPWKRQDWNDIIDAVNALAQNPDSGCTAVDPLEEVGPDHIWTIGDVQAVRDKLTEICDENTFPEELKLWKQSVIDEINTAINNGWCNCCDPNAEEWKYDLGESIVGGGSVTLLNCTSIWEEDGVQIPPYPDPLYPGDYVAEGLFPVFGIRITTLFYILYCE